MRNTLLSAAAVLVFVAGCSSSTPEPPSKDVVHEAARQYVLPEFAGDGVIIEAETKEPIRGAVIDGEDMFLFRGKAEGTINGKLGQVDWEAMANQSKGVVSVGIWEAGQRRVLYSAAQSGQ